MAKVVYSNQKNKFVLLGLVICLICLLFFSTTFALLAFQENFSVDITLGYISLNEIGKASLDVSGHDEGELVCSDGVSFVKDQDSRNFYARVNIYFYSTDDLTVSNKKYISLLNGMIEPAAYDDYMWSNRYVDSYYLTTTYGAPYEIDEFTDINKRFYFLDSLVLGENTAVFLSKYDRPEHLYINVEIQAIQSEYLDVENPTLEQVRNLFVQHFGDVNRLDYQVILYHDIYNELFDIGFAEYGQKVFEPAQPQFIIGNFKHWCTTSKHCSYICTASTCSCGKTPCKCKTGGCEGGACPCSSCVCSDAYDFSLPVTEKLYLYARYDVEMGNIEDLYIFETNTDGTYSISQNFRKDANGNYQRYRVDASGNYLKDGNGNYIVDNTSSGRYMPMPQNGIVIPKVYNFTRVTQIKFLVPKNIYGTTLISSSNLSTYGGFTSAFGNNKMITGVVISDSIVTIDNYSFKNATNILDVAMFDGLKTIGSQAFYGCNKIKTVVVPNTVISIGAQAFGACYSIETIELPFVGGKLTSASGNEKLFGYIFSNSSDSNMTRIRQLSGLTVSDFDVIRLIESGSTTSATYGVFQEYDGRSLMYDPEYNGGDLPYKLMELYSITLSIAKDFYIPKNLYSITINGGEIHDFSLSDANGMRSVTTINFGKNITRIGSFACCGLWIQSLNISDCMNLTGIAGYAFFNCQVLTTVKIENNPILREIGEGAFAWDWAMDSISLEGCDQLKILGDSIFAGCTELTSAYLPLFVQTIGNFAFLGCTKVELPVFSDRLQTIGEFAFYDCEKINKLDLSQTVLTKVGHYAFDLCENVSLVRFPSSLKTIGNYSFAHCGLLRTFDIPKSVTYMGTGCIAGCYQLSELVLPYVGKLKTTGPGSASADSAIKSSSTAENLFGIIFSTETTTYHEKNLDVATEMLNKTTYNSEYYNANPTEYSINLQGCYKYSLYYNYTTYYGAYSYVFTYIPKSITRVTVLGGYVRIGTFSGLSTISEFIIGKDVVGIDRQAFIDTVNVTNMSLPFVGTSPEFADANVNSLFGVIFDSHPTYGDYNSGGWFGTYDDADANLTTKVVRIVQHFGESSTQTKEYIIPSDLVSITVTGGKLEYGCLSGIAYLRSASIEEGCRGLGKNMFYNDINLTSLTLGLITDDADINAPSISTLLGYYFGTSDTTYYNGYYKVQQRYKKGTTFDLEAWVPESLKNITINGGHIQYGACMNFTNLNNVLITGNAKTIGDYAFFNTGITSLTVQNLRILTTFGDYAFADNGNLTKAVFANNQLLVNLSNHLFENCGQLATIEHSGSPKLATAEVSTFANCKSIAYMKDVLPETVIAIGDYCFEGCEGLQQIDLYPALLEAGRYAFLNCINADVIYYGKLDEDSGEFIKNEYFDKISEGMFKGCESLTTLTIGEYITEIGAYAFSRCSGAESIEYNDIINYLPYRCFEYCKGLTSIIIGELIQTMEEAVFSHCEGATEIVYNTHITAIPKQTFEHCYNLRITFGDTVTSFGDYAFAFSSRSGSTPRKLNFEASNVVTSFGKACFAFAGLTQINISDKSGITYGNYCFYENRSATTVTFPSDMKKIPKYFYANNTSLQTLTLPETLDYTATDFLGQSCFEYCTSLKTINFPTKCTLINNKAFRGCTGITTLNVPYHIKKIDDEAFAGIYDGRALFYTTATGYTAPYRSDLSDYIHYNDDCSRFIREDNPSTTHPDEKTLYNWFTWKYDTTVPYEPHIGSAAESLIGTILNGITSNPLGMKITTLTFETWSAWDTISGNASQVNTIGTKAFYLNTSLTKVILPKALTTLGQYAFASYNKDGYRMAMDYVIVPYGSALTSIGSYAFEQNWIYQLHFLNMTTAPSLGNTYAFRYNSSLSSSTSIYGVSGTQYRGIYVPYGSVTNYTNKSYWNNSNIKAYVYGNWNGRFDKSGALDVTMYGAGTSTSNAYQIFHANQLTYIEEQVNFNGNTYSNKYFKVMRDVYFSASYNWRPIGYINSRRFNGKIDGNSKTIQYLTITGVTTTKGLFPSVTVSSYANDTEGTQCLGFIGYAETGSSISNLKFSNLKIEITRNVVNTAGIVASNHGTISNCTVEGSIKITNSSTTTRVGGISAGSYSGIGGTPTVSNCTNKASINATANGYYVAGGIVAYTNYTTTVSNCTNEGTIQGGATGGGARNFVGGVVGECGGNSTVSSCTNKGAITLTSTTPVDVGGIIGRFYNGSKMTSAKNTANINASSSSSYRYVGGYIGVVSNGGDNPEANAASGATFDNSTISIKSGNEAFTLNAGTNSSYSFAGGIVGRTSQTLNNLTFYGNMTATAYYIGGITSALYHRFNVTNCTTASGSVVKSSYSYAYVGGIVGYVNNTSAAISSYHYNKNYASVSSGYYTGGIIGYLYSTQAVTLYYGNNYGAITGYSTSTSYYVGGLLGRIYVSSGNTKIYYFKNSGAIKTGGYAGGVVGYFNRYAYSDFMYLENSGTISNSSYAGGIVGRISNSSAAITAWLDACKNSGNVTGSSYAGGIVAYFLNTFWGGSQNDTRTGRDYYKVRSCTNTGTISGGTYAGGMVGFGSCLIDSCTSGVPSGGTYRGSAFGGTYNPKEYTYKTGIWPFQTTRYYYRYFYTISGGSLPTAQIGRWLNY